jgi:hypothetical protein
MAGADARLHRSAPKWVLTERDNGAKLELTEEQMEQVVNNFLAQYKLGRVDAEFHTNGRTYVFIPGGR